MMEITKDNIIGYFENIIEICNKTTSGNVSHQMGLIKYTYPFIVNKIKEQYGEIMAYHNFAHIIELASRCTTGNVAHNVATIKGLCNRNIDYIKEYGLTK